MGETATVLRDCIGEGELMQVQEFYEAGPLDNSAAERAAFRDRAESYERLLNAIAESGRMVIDRLSEGSRLTYFDPIPENLDPYGKYRHWEVDKGRAERLEGARLKGAAIYVDVSPSSADKTQEPEVQEPQIEFTHGRTQYQGLLSDLEWHLAPIEE